MRPLRILCVLIAPALCLIATTTEAQTVRFETSVGHFDIVLNPTDNPNLQPLVDNLLAYVGTGRYYYTAINRAVDGNNTNPADDFILQMGSLLGFPRNPQLWAGLSQPVERFNNVILDSDGIGGIDFDTTGLENTRGTVSFALAPGDVNSATSSFFVNLSDTNTFLDAQGFVPFAEVPDMTTIDTIMELMQTNLAQGVNSPTFNDVPLLDNGKIVILQRVFLIDAPEGFSFVGPIQNASGGEAFPAALAAASASAADASGGSVSLTSTPEPGALALLLTAAAGLSCRRRR